MVTVNVPAFAVLPAAKERGREPEAVLVPKDEVKPGGKPETERLMFPLKPLTGETEMTIPALVPLGTLIAPEEVTRLKFGTATVTINVAVLLRLPDTPVTVTVEVDVEAELLAARMIDVPTLLPAGENVAVTP